MSKLRLQGFCFKRDFYELSQVAQVGSRRNTSATSRSAVDECEDEGKRINNKKH